MTATVSFSRFLLRIWVGGEYCKVIGGVSWKGKALSGHKQNLAGEFCVVGGEFSDLRCLMNTLPFVFCGQLCKVISLRTVLNNWESVGKALGKRWKSVGIYPLNGKALVYVFLWEVTYYGSYHIVVNNLLKLFMSLWHCRFNHFIPKFFMENWFSYILFFANAKCSM